MPEVAEIAFQARAIHERILVNALGHSVTQGSCLFGALLLASMLENFGNCKTVLIRGGDGCGDGGYRDAAGAWHGHYWVEVSDGSRRMVVDITADQFGGPKVVVLAISSAGNYVPGDQETVDIHVAEEKLRVAIEAEPSTST